MHFQRWFGMVAVVAVLAAACGDDDDDDVATPPSSDAAAVDATIDEPGSTTTTDPLAGTTETSAGEPASGDGGCPEAGAPFTSTGVYVDADGEEIPLTAGEIGVTDTTITIGVYAAVDNPFVPGLAEGNRDAVYIWRDWINANCGLAGRNVEVEFYDTKLDIGGTEFPAAQAAACGAVLAVVAGYEVFDGNVQAMANCPDAAGAPTGLPDLAVVVGDPNHYLNPTTYAVIPPGPISALYDIGSAQHLQETEGPLRGVYLVPNDIPASLVLQNNNFTARAQAGIEEVQRFEFSAREENYDPFTQALIDGDANYAEQGGAVSNYVRWQQNVAQLAPDLDVTWFCASACYDQNLFAAGADVVEGSYVSIQHLPFEERAENELLDAYLTIAEEGGYKTDSLGFQGFSAAVAMGDVIQAIVDEQGPNAITRAAILEGLAGMHDYDGHGIVGPTDIGGRVPAGCTVLMQARGGEFVRVYPEEPGTLNCETDNLVQVGDPLVGG
jgi:hypothetical protein